MISAPPREASPSIAKSAISNPAPLGGRGAQRRDEKRIAAGLNGAGDFILAREMVGMLLAQEVYVICREHKSAPWLGSVYHEILHAASAEMRLRPVPPYAEGQDRPSFAHLAASARARGEIAMGVVEAGLRPYLLPRREEGFEASEDSRLVVLTRASGKTARAEEFRHASKVERAKKGKKREVTV